MASKLVAIMPGFALATVHRGQDAAIDGSAHASVVSPNCRTCWSSGFSREMRPTMRTWCPRGTPAWRINANLREEDYQPGLILLAMEEIAAA